jgi:hypothetical protein
MVTVCTTGFNIKYTVHFVAQGMYMYVWTYVLCMYYVYVYVCIMYIRMYVLCTYYVCMYVSGTIGSRNIDRLRSLWGRNLDDTNNSDEHQPSNAPSSRDTWRPPLIWNPDSRLIHRQDRQKTDTIYGSDLVLSAELMYASHGTRGQRRLAVDH